MQKNFTANQFQTMFQPYSYKLKFKIVLSVVQQFSKLALLLFNQSAFSFFRAPQFSTLEISLQ